MQTGEFIFFYARKPLKIPPRNAVLCTDDGSVIANQMPQLRRQLRKAVRFHAEEDDVGVVCFRQTSDHARAYLEITVTTDYAQTMFLHGFEMRPSREQSHIAP